MRTLALTLIVLVSPAALAQTTQPGAEQALPDLEELLQAVEEVVLLYYPHATVTRTERGASFAYSTRTFLVHLPDRLGNWQDATEMLGPLQGGVLLELELRPGEYGGAAELPQTFDLHYFKVHSRAPYDAEHDCYLYTHLNLPLERPPVGFLESLLPLVDGFGVFLEPAGSGPTRIQRLWRLIEDAREHAAGDQEKQVVYVTLVLGQIPPMEILSLGRAVDDLLGRSCTWELWGAARYVGGPCDQDCYLAFCQWLILQGQAAFTVVLDAPDRLTELEQPFGQCAELRGLFRRAYEARTGAPMPSVWTLELGPRGEPVDLEDADGLASRYPLLRARKEREREE